jgi:hypothetical protein
VHHRISKQQQMVLDHRDPLYQIQETSSSSSNFADSSVKDLGEEEDWAIGDDEMALVEPTPDDNDEEDMKEIEIEPSSPRALLSSQEDSEYHNLPYLCLMGLFFTVRFFSSSLYPSLWCYLTAGGPRSCA